MSLGFLFPLAWLGALAVAVPLWLHLQRKADPHARRFSALQFLDDQPLAQRRPFWPRQWPLLLLRLLSLLCLVAAFSWPFFQSPREIVIRESRVYLLDATLSRQAEDGFDRDRDRLAGELARLDDNVQAAVVVLEAQPRILAGFEVPGTEAAERVGSLEVTAARGSLADGFRTAARLLEQSLGEVRRIKLLSDNQQNQWDEAQGVSLSLAGVEVDLPDTDETPTANVAVMEPLAQRQMHGNTAVVQCAVRIYHQGPAGEIALVVRDGERETFRELLALPADSGTQTRIAAWEVDPNQWVRGEVTVQWPADVLAGDNRVVFSLPPVREGVVELWAESPYLRTALSPEIVRGRWRVQNAEVAAGLAPQSLADVIVVESGLLRDTEARQRLLDHLNAGRGGLLVLDQMNSVVAGFLRQFDIRSLGSDNTRPTQFRYWFKEHPVLEIFRGVDYGNLLDVSVRANRRVEADGALPLIFAESGDVLLLESLRAKGRLFVCTFALDRQETDWPLQPSFLPFLDRCLSQAREVVTAPPNCLPGEACAWRPPDATGASRVVARSEDGSVTAEADVRDGVARIPLPPAAGRYTLSYAGETEVRGMLDVNPSPLESQLTYQPDPPILQQWLADEPAGAPATLNEPDTAWQLSDAEIQRQRIWWWLLLAGVAGLLIETGWLAARKERT